MVDDPTANPRGPIPGTYDSGLGELGVDARRSLVEELGEVADDLRQVAVDLGAMPYTVHAVRIRWSGNEIGRGDPQTVFDQPLKPTPKVGSVSAWERRLETAGVVERGDAVLTGVSPRYTEDELTHYLSPNVDGEEAFFEVRIDERDGTTTRRRFVLATVPERRPTRLDWRLKLTAQDADRERDGTPRAPRERVWPNQG
jgi:hypothetical protein